MEEANHADGGRTCQVFAEEQSPGAEKACSCFSWILKRSVHQVQSEVEREEWVVRRIT